MRQTNNFLKDIGKNKSYLVLSLPAVLYFFLFSYIPLFGIIVAFKDFNVKDGILFSPWSGLKNFEFFFSSQDAARITFNTLFLNSTFIIFGLLFQVAFAIMLNELGSGLFVKVSQSVMFLPYFISWVIVGYFGIAFLNMDNGFLNTMLQDIGMKPVMWYNEPKYWPLILNIANIWKLTGYGSIIYYAVIMGINKEYYEAGKIDGANRWQQITNITIPSIMPVTSMLFLLGVGRIFYADFGMFYNLIRENGPLFSTADVMDTYVFRALRVTGDMGIASAAGLFQSIVGFITVVLSNFAVRKYDRDYSLF